MSSRAPGNPIPEFGFAYYNRGEILGFSGNLKLKMICDIVSLIAFLKSTYLLITFSKYISKNLFFAASVSNPFTPLTDATPPKKFASPIILRQKTTETSVNWAYIIT